MLICAIWTGVHSLLASKAAKDLLARTAGPRSRAGLYPRADNAPSLAPVAWAARRLARARARVEARWCR